MKGNYKGRPAPPAPPPPRTINEDITFNHLLYLGIPVAALLIGVMVGLSIG